MDAKALGHSVLTFLIALAGGSIFLFVASGFVPENCIVATSSNNCFGLASFLPRGLQGLLFVALVLWCVYLAIKEYRESAGKNAIKKKNSEYIAKLRGK